MTLRGLGVAILGAVFFVSTATDVQAKRVGGGGSLGAQRSIATPAKPATASAQTQPVAANKMQAAPAQTPAAAGSASRWLPMLGGLALGGLLGSMFGGGAMGAIGLFILLALVAGIVIVVFARRRAEPRSVSALQFAAAPAGSSPYGTLGAETMVPPLPVQGSAQDSDRPAGPGPKVPAGFDTQGFLRAAKLNFIKLQVANDKGNLEEIRETTTPEMFEALRKPIVERRGAAQQTDVVSLNADLLEVTTEGDKHYASVRFSGMVWEVAGSMPQGFEEIWNLVKPVDGSSGWLLAGIQQTH